MSDFIDRAKLEDAADQWLIEDENWGDRHHESFLAGAAAYAALLDAETTEEWGVELNGGEIREWSTDGLARADALEVSTVTDRDGKVTEFPRRLVSRRVTPWLPPEVGEKRG